ncbi:MAG: 4-(cytidine 5'-diphospho)-2-C-methyl-D-erythritol kinase [Lachnospiraceae bacterium]|nr:4-(cytidine 5'-diphospho)-2-C-methyl-D-erythritol kinase [Lachnospiraceae bacterium]
MKYLNIKSRAKINLTLDICGKRDDGYHDIETIMQTLNFCDNIYILKTGKEGIKLKTNLSWLPSDSSNIAYKAAKLIMDEYSIKSGVFIELSKRIPVSAGLAGGSGNAAAVLKGMNKLFELNISKDKLMEYALMLGSDVPYMLLGKTAKATGRGEVLTKLANMPSCRVVLAKPRINVSTAFVYKNFDMSSVCQRPDTKAMISAIENSDIKGIAANLCNVLESVTLKAYPIIGEIKTRLVENGALGALMSGSGPTVFGMFENKDTAEAASLDIKKRFNIKDVYVVSIF